MVWILTRSTCGSESGAGASRPRDDGGVAKVAQAGGERLFRRGPGKAVGFLGRSLSAAQAGGRHILAGGVSHRYPPKKDLLGRRPTHPCAVTQGQKYVPPSGLKIFMLAFAPGPDDPGSSCVGLRPEEGCWLLRPEAGISLPVASATGIATKESSRPEADTSISGNARSKVCAALRAEDLL